MFTSLSPLDLKILAYIINSKVNSISVLPNEQGPLFTLPAIQMPNGSYVMDSYKIADIIEEKHPEPSVHLNTPVQLIFRNILMNLMQQLTPIYVPGIAQRILSNESLDFFITARQKDIGMPLDKFGEQQGPGAFDRAEPFIHEMTALLNKSSSGPYFLGDIVSYTDFIWAAILLFFKCLGDDMYEELLMRSGDAEAHTNFLDALSLWIKSD